MNQVAIVGRLGRDPELRATQSGTSVAKCSIAVDRVGPAGAKETDWFDVVAFNKTAESLATFMKKGGRIGISGRLQQEKWTDQQTGQKRSRVVIMAQQIDFLERPAQEAQPAEADHMPFADATDVPGW